MLGAAIGVPAPSSAAVWGSEPFEAGVVGSLSGQVAVKSARVTLTPRLAAQDVRAVVQFGPSEFALQKIEGGFADGRLTGDLAFERSAEGLSARGQVKIAAADIAELFPGDGRPPMSGRLSVDVDLVGTGRSPIALIGSLNGSGSLQWQDGRVMRLNPAAFEAVARAIDQGLPIDPIRVHDRMELAFANGSLPIPMAEGRLIVSNGQLRLGNPDVRPHGADLSPTGSIDLAENVIDARLVLSGPEVAGAPADTRPEVVIALKGSIDAPRRTLDVASFTSWLALRAVEQQAKRIDVLEAGGEIVPAPTAHIGPAPAIPPITTTPAAPPALSAPRPIIRGAPEATATTRQRPAAVPPSVPAPLDIRPSPR